MTLTQKKEIIMLGCFSEDSKRGGIKTFVDSLSSFLNENGYKILKIPQSQIARSSYSCLIKTKIDSLTMKIPPSAIAIAQRPDGLLMFKTSNRKNKTICVMHSDNLKQIDMKKNKVVAKIFRIMEKQGLKKADRIVCVDQSTFNIYVKKYPWIKSKVVVIPVGVNASVFVPVDKSKCRKEFCIPDGSKVMLVVARLEKEKNVSGAIELVRDHFDFENHLLLIVGIGTQEQKLKEMAKGIKNAKVKFLGQIQHETLPKIISASDVVIVPSLLESGPLIIIEAMACGVPAVSTNVGRAKIFIADTGCGSVVDAVNNEFAEKVKTILYSNISVKEICIERVKMFSFHNTGVETMKLIEELS